MITDVLISDGSRDGVINYIKTQKQKGKFTVVDIGGSVNGWSSPYIDALVDFNVPENLPNHITHYQSDITHPDSWKKILDDVNKNEKFDFCICTHTLEDIMNPGFVCEQMSKIAHAGYIAVPSKQRELSRFEYSCYRGYIHHRWIFAIHENQCIGFPKINYIDSVNIFDAVANVSNSCSDLSFYWNGEMKIHYINNNYLGPSVEHVVNYYNQLCNPAFV
jgi:hypothetical protein